MATLQEVIDAVDQDKAAVEAAAARVTADLAGLKQQIQDLQDQIAAGGGVTSEQLDALKATVDAVTGEAEAIDPTP
jgi:septal ring factor EnvC (AmiA/AmiB activator)